MKLREFSLHVPHGYPFKLKKVYATSHKEFEVHDYWISTFKWLWLK